MQLDHKDKSYIITAFSRMRTKEDLLELLNYVKPFIFGAQSIPLELKQLTYHLHPAANSNRYRTFSRKKKSGGVRIITAPSRGLKAIQKCLNLILQVLYESDLDKNKAANGFVPGRSIVDNARIHVGQNYVYNIDLKDFFPSIDQARIWGRLQHPPFNLNVATGRLDICNAIAVLCCHQMEVERLDENGAWVSVVKNVLPQGAPTSPTLSNIICQRLDFYLTAVAKRFGLRYSRYADDITFSSMHNEYQPGGNFETELHRIIAKEKFNIKEAKTRLQKQGYRQEVTGLSVNQVVNVSRKYIKELRKWLYYWEQYGYDVASNYFLPHYQHRKDNMVVNPSLAQVLQGKLHYLKMVKGEKSTVYVTLQNRFNGLINPEVLEKKASRLQVPIEHKPLELVGFLKNFSADRSPLKFTTHTWDAGVDTAGFTDIPTFLRLARERYDGFSFMLNALSRNLNAKIFHFLFVPEVGLEGWGTHRIKFGWSSPELALYHNQNKNSKPEDFVLPATAQMELEGRVIKKFRQVIDVFKNEIEIRDENSALMTLMLTLHDKYLPDFAPAVVTNLENKNFYTDVQWLTKALEAMLVCISQRSTHKNVEYSALEDEHTITLEILHRDSFCLRSIHDERFKLIKGDFSSIKNWLLNLCDWSVESVFKEGAYRINFLTSNDKVPAHEKIENAPGFKYKLIFYK